MTEDLTRSNQLLRHSPLLEEPVRDDIREALETTVEGYVTRDPTDPGMALIEALAVAIDQIGLYHDRHAAETKIDTALLLGSLQKLAEIPGLSAPPARSTRIIQQFVAEEPAEVPAGTVVTGKSAAGATAFETESHLDIHPALNAAPFSPVVSLRAGATRAALAVAEQVAGSLASVSPADVFWPGAVVLVQDPDRGAELVSVESVRASVVTLMRPLLSAYPDAQTRVRCLTDVREMRHWWPGTTTRPDPDLPADAWSDLLWVEASDLPVMHVQDAKGAWLSTLEVFVQDDPALDPSSWPADSRWTEVPDFTDSKSEDQHYRMFVDDRLHTWISFRAVRAIRPLRAESIQVRFVPRLTAAGPSAHDAVSLWRPAFESPIVSAGKTGSLWAVTHEDPGLVIGDEIVLVPKEGASQIRTLGPKTSGRMLDWQRAFKDLDSDGEEPENPHTAVDPVVKATDLEVFSLEDAAGGLALTRLPIQRRLRWGGSVDKPTLQKGDTVLALSDPTVVKVGDTLLVGSWEGGDPVSPWRTAEVVKVAEIIGSTVQLKEPILGDYGDQVRILASPSPAESGVEFWGVSQQTLLPVKPKASTAVNAGDDDNGKGPPKPAPIVLIEKEVSVLRKYAIRVGNWLLGIADDLSPKVEPAVEKPGEEEPAPVSAPIVGGTYGVTLRFPSADMVVLKDWERSSPKKKVRQEYIDTVENSIQVFLVREGDPVPLPFVESAGADPNRSFDVQRTPTGETSISIAFTPKKDPGKNVDAEVRIRMYYAAPPPKTGGTTKDAGDDHGLPTLVGIDPRSTLYLSESASLKPGADVFLTTSTGSILRSVVESVDGNEVKLDDGFATAEESDLLYSELTAWNEDAVPYALHEDYYALPLEASASTVPIPVGSTLIVDHTDPSLVSLAVGDPIRVWDEPYRRAWQCNREGAETSDPEDWWTWPDRQAVAKVASVDNDIGLISLDKPLPEILVDGVEERLRVLLASPGTLFGSREVDGVRTIRELASGPRFQITLDSTDPTLTMGLDDGREMGDFDVLVRDPKTLQWTPWPRVASLEGLEVPGVVLRTRLVNGRREVTLAFGDDKGPGLPPSGQEPVRLRRVLLGPPASGKQSDRDEDAPWVPVTDPTRSTGNGELDCTAWFERRASGWQDDDGWGPVVQPLRAASAEYAAAVTSVIPQRPGMLRTTETVRVLAASTEWQMSARVYQELLTVDATVMPGATTLMLPDLGSLVRGDPLVLYQSERDANPEIAMVESTDPGIGVITLQAPLARSYPGSEAKICGNTTFALLGQTSDIDLGVSTGEPNQLVPLVSVQTVLFTQTDEGLARQDGVVIAGTTTWTAVDSLGTVDERSHSFSLDLQSGTPCVVFGDGVHGAVPPAGVALVGQFRMGDPQTGIVDPGTVIGMDTAIDGVSATSNLTGAAVALGEATVPEARETILGSINSGGGAEQKLLTVDDIAAAAMALAPTTLARTRLHASKSNRWKLYITVLYEYVNDVDDIAESLQTQLQALMPTLSGVELTVVPATPLVVEMQAEIVVDAGREGEVIDAVHRDLLDRDDGFFAPKKWGIGTPLRVNDAERWLENLGALTASFESVPSRDPSGVLMAPEFNEVVTAGLVSAGRVYSAQKGLSTIELIFQNRADIVGNEVGS